MRDCYLLSYGQSSSGPVQHQVRFSEASDFAAYFEKPEPYGVPLTVLTALYILETKNA